MSLPHLIIEREEDGTLSSITIDGVDIREIYNYCKIKTLENPQHIDYYVRKYVAARKTGRPRTLPDDSNLLTPEQQRKRAWNENSKEHLSKYNKRRREEKKMLSNSNDDNATP